MPENTSSGFSHRILVVDDDPTIRDTAAVVLRSKGYEVRTAEDGFDALLELRRALPDIIISDLKMPNMSGFEFLSIVRRRFPHIAVIVISGEYVWTTRNGLIADAFFAKGHYTPEQLFLRIEHFLEESPIRPHIAKPDRAPVWIPKNATGYFVLTCPECLRSFSIPAETGETEVRETECTFCDAKVRYLADLRAVS
jgi:CheY-like chemotaxis protein